MAAAGGDLHIYAREQAGEWTEVLLSEDSEQIDQDGNSILEALYEQYVTIDGDEQTEASEGEREEPEDEEEQSKDDEELPEDDEEPEDEEPADDDEEEKPRRSRGRTRAKKK